MKHSAVMQQILWCLSLWWYGGNGDVLVFQDPDKKTECGLLLGTISEDKFAQLVAIGKLITDYVPESERQVCAAHTVVFCNCIYHRLKMH